MEKQIKLADLGFNGFFENHCKQLGLESFVIARIIAEHKGSYRVKAVSGEYTAKVTGK